MSLHEIPASQDVTESPEKIRGWNVYLSMPELTNPNLFVEGQRASLGGMWYCKGRLGEREYDGATNTFQKTDTPLSRRLTNQVRRAKAEFMKLQYLYMRLGQDPELHNDNGELQFAFEFNATTGSMLVETCGYRLPRGEQGYVSFSGSTVKNVFKQYRLALEEYTGLRAE